MTARGVLKKAEEAPDGLDVTFTVDRSLYKSAVRLLAEGELDIKAERHKESRSLNANSYFWVLADRIAAAIGSDREAVYLLMLKRYGVFEDAYIKAGALESFRRAYRLVEAMPGGDGSHVWARCYFGSSTYDAAEMARLIDGTVADAEELGIETMPPDELSRLKAAWGTEKA